MEIKLHNSTSHILEYAMLRQVALSPDALLELQDKDYKAIIDKASAEGLFIVEKYYVNLWKTTQKEPPVSNDNIQEVVIKKSKYIYAEDIEPDLKVRHETDITNKGSTRGKIDEFHNFFEERFTTLSSILKLRPSINPISSKNLKKYAKNDSVILIGMLSSKNLSKNGNYLLTLEDIDGEFKVVVMQKDALLFDIAKHVIDDDIIAITGTKLDEGIIIAKSIEYPDLPNRTQRKASRDVYAATISDIHVGSKLFFNDEFEKFIDYISLKNLDDKDYQVASKIKYLFIAGDVVDGIGVYPAQHSELNMFSIYEQYEKLSEYLDRIPDYIEIVIGPGNHDSVRLADPQPAIPKEFAKPLYNINNISMVGSPVWCEVEGLKLLMYHGNSMISIQSALNLDFTKPDLAMIEYLKRRDLASLYGTRHPILPEKGGYMLIKEEPDIFITGHIHSNAYNNYRGTMIINPGTWQAQSTYQKEQGHIPTPGRVPIIKLNQAKIDERVFVNDFTKE